MAMELPRLLAAPLKGVIGELVGWKEVTPEDAAVPEATGTPLAGLLGVAGEAGVEALGPAG